jgi:hypothetical protein
MGGLKKVTSPFREFGVGAGALYALDRVLRRLSPRLGLYVYEMMCQPIGAKPLVAERIAAGYEVVEIGPDHPDVARMPAREEVKRQRFEQQAKCLGLYRKGVLVGFIWFAFGRYQEDEVRCLYRLDDPERAVFDFDLYVFPEYRMGTAFMAIWDAANRHLHARGVAHSFSRMTRFNLASRRAHMRLGSLRIGSALFLRIGPIEAMLATLHPYVGITWGVGSNTHLVLRS